MALRSQRGWPGPSSTEMALLQPHALPPANLPGKWSPASLGRGLVSTFPGGHFASWSCRLEMRGTEVFPGRGSLEMPTGVFYTQRVQVNLEGVAQPCEASLQED